MVFSGTEHLVEVLDKLSATAVDFFRSERELKYMCLYGGFVEQIKHITLAPGECLSSYDVFALFTSVPVDPALNIIKDVLAKDHTLKERTVLAVSDIILLLEFCLKNT